MAGITESHAEEIIQSELLKLNVTNLKNKILKKAKGLEKQYFSFYGDSYTYAALAIFSADSKIPVGKYKFDFYTKQGFEILKQGVITKNKIFTSSLTNGSEGNLLVLDTDKINSNANFLSLVIENSFRDLNQEFKNKTIETAFKLNERVETYSLKDCLKTALALNFYLAEKEQFSGFEEWLRNDKTFVNDEHKVWVSENKILIHKELLQQAKTLDDLIFEKSIFDEVIVLEKSKINSEKELWNEVVKYELRVLGYKNETIEKLAPKITEKAVELKGLTKKRKSRDLLSAAIALTCRGEYNCPINIKKYYTKGRKIITECNEKLVLNPNELYVNTINKLKDELKLSDIVSENCIELFDFIYSKYSKQVNLGNVLAFAAGAVYLMARKHGDCKTQREITQVLGTKEGTIRSYANKIAEFIERN